MDSAFNKHTNDKKNGTLIANWQEERAMKEFQGVGRTITREHIPKRHHDFENPIVTDKVFDNTYARIHGQLITDEFRPTSETWGKDKNPAHNIPRVGRMNQLMEQQYQEICRKELKEKDDEYFRSTQQRRFDTWQRGEFIEKDLTVNTIGKKVMTTQDGQNVPMEQRDDQLIVESGMWRRTQKGTDDELKERIPAGDYDKQVPVTFYTEHLDRKNVYGSASTGPNPFAITRGMTQPVQATHAIQGYEGNVNFDKEKTTLSNMRESRGPRKE